MSNKKYVESLLLQGTEHAQRINISHLHCSVSASPPFRLSLRFPGKSSLSHLVPHRKKARFLCRWSEVVAYELFTTSWSARGRDPRQAQRQAPSSEGQAPRGTARTAACSRPWPGHLYIVVCVSVRTPNDDIYAGHDSRLCSLKFELRTAVSTATRIQTSTCS